MMKRVVLITGRLYTGKSGLADSLRNEYGFHVFKTSSALQAIAKKRRHRHDRRSLQLLGDTIDNETRHRWVHTQVKTYLRENPDSPPIVVDNIRNAKQLEWFRKDHKIQVTHVHLYASQADLENRFSQRNKGRNAQEYWVLDLIKNDRDVDFFKEDADVRINTARTDDQDTLVRVAAALGLFAQPNLRCVDVIVGGQYGSEGKGQVAAYLSKEYDVLVRVGGPNAGHTVSSSSGVFTYHQLPSGAKDTNAQLLLGPGMTINVKALLEEVEECRVTEDRLFIDPQAMVIDKSDLASEGVLVSKIGSTGSGSGAAAARRIMGRRRGAVKLARDISYLRPYVGTGPRFRGSTLEQLELAYREGCSILLEGTQGSGLSLFHGQFPYVTSRDTNVAGCLAEAGISPSRVRRILVVVRVTPIRVGNPDGGKETSGRLKHETTFQIVAQKSGIDVSELVKNEKTSTTRRPRRVGWFEWELFRRSCALNAPTDIVLTFADYMGVQNRNARRFEQLSPNTIKFIEELERVAHAPVSLINTRFPREEDNEFDLRTVIDRRNWVGGRSREPE